MKKLFIILHFTFYILHSSFAQTYVPFDTANAVWRAERGYKLSPGIGGNDEFHTINYNLYTYDDTIANGFIYHKLYETGVDNYVAIPPIYTGTITWNHQYTGAFREDSSKHIYYISQSNTTEYLLYDFNLNLGDTLQATYLSQPNFNYVSKVDSIFDGMMYRKRYTVSTDTINPMNYNYASLIEGIGSSTGLLWQLSPPFESGGILYYYKANNVVKYVDSVYAICTLVEIAESVLNETQIKLYPNPASDQFTISSKQFAINKIEIMNILGETVLLKEPKTRNFKLQTSNFPHGIYIIKAYSAKETFQQKLIIAR